MKITIIIASIVFLCGAAYIGWWHRVRVEADSYVDWLARATPTEGEIAERFPLFSMSVKKTDLDYIPTEGKGDRFFELNMMGFNKWSLQQMHYGVMACLGSGLFLIGMYFGRRSKAS